MQWFVSSLHVNLKHLKLSMTVAFVNSAREDYEKTTKEERKKLTREKANKDSTGEESAAKAFPSRIQACEVCAGGGHKG